MALFPEQLDAGDIELRRNRLEMCDALCEASAASFEELHEWMPWAHDPPTRESVGEFLRQAETDFDEDRQWAYVLVEKSTGDVVGGSGVRINDNDRSCPEIGYWVRSDRAGRGYATHAAGALAEAAFLYLSFDRVKIRMDLANAASAAVAQKVGCRLLDEEERPRVTPGHTGRGYIWVLDREPRG
jgi:ribosomal-protein-serine acetyltransferase